MHNFLDTTKYRLSESYRGNPLQSTSRPILISLGECILPFAGSDAVLSSNFDMKENLEICEGLP